MVQIFRVNLGLSPVAKGPISQYISQYLAIPIEFGHMKNGDEADVEPIRDVTVLVAAGIGYGYSQLANFPVRCGLTRLRGSFGRVFAG
jgi:hypothetical protein